MTSTSERPSLLTAKCPHCWDPVDACRCDPDASVFLHPEPEPEMPCLFSVPDDEQPTRQAHKLLPPSGDGVCP